MVINLLLSFLVFQLSVDMVLLGLSALLLLPLATAIQAKGNTNFKVYLVYCRIDRTLCAKLINLPSDLSNNLCIAYRLGEYYI